MMFFCLSRFAAARGTPWSGQQGNVAVTVALSLVLLVGVLAFTLDTGYLFTTENSFQNAVDASALAGAAELCTEDITGIAAVVKDILLANGLPLEDSRLTVETGFYDEGDHYDDFDEYADFVVAKDMPADEFINAVCVTYTGEDIGLTGLNSSTSVTARAVAYLRRLDIVSLDTEEGEIHLGHNSSWDRTVFFSNGDIKYPEMVSIKGKSYNMPTFNDCKLLSAGEVLKCPVQVTPRTNTAKISVQWNSGTPQSGGDIRTGLAPVTGIRPVDEKTLNYWRERADIVYTPDQAGRDDVFAGIGENQLVGGDYYFVDPAAEPGGNQRVIFFDTGDNTAMPVVIGTVIRSGGINAHTPNGNTITNLVFVATCSIHVINFSGSSNKAVPDLHVGGEGNDQVVFISTEDIEIYPARGSDVIFDGAVFRTGGDFILNYGGSGDIHRIRIISDGNIHGRDYAGNEEKVDQGLNMKNDSRFGPPCPPVLPKLGRLVVGDR